MQIKEIELPTNLKSDDLNGFYLDLIRKVESVKEALMQGKWEGSKLLEVKIAGSNKVYKLGLEELTHLGKDTLNLPDLTELTPANFLLSMYVLSDEPVVGSDENYNIKVIAEEDRVELCIPGRAVTYLLSDFLAVHRKFLRSCILKLDKTGKHLTKDHVYGIQQSYILSYERSINFPRTGMYLTLKTLDEDQNADVTEEPAED